MKMAGKTLKTKKRKIAPKKAEKAERKVVLVGTYREGQLAWIGKHLLYNYPVREGDKFDAAALGKVSELWLYAGTKGKRHCYEAKFVRQMTRGEWLKENPTYAKLGRSKNKAYYVFEVKPLEYGTRFDAPEVITRVADFGGRSAKIKNAIEQYQKDGEFASLAAYLPTELAQVPKEQLRVCEPWVQMEFMQSFDFDAAKQTHVETVKAATRAHQEGKLTCVEICAGAGGQAIGLERAGFTHVALVECESEYFNLLLAA